MSSIQKPKLLIVFYSTFMNVYKLALAIKEGAEKVNEIDVEIYQVKETLSDSILAKKGAPEKPDIPIITPELLKEADGILFGFPACFGLLPAQLKDFIDSCGSLWASGAMQGKLAGIFNSTELQHSGQETTAFTFITILAHFGMIFVPNGYSCLEIHEDKEILGGSPWGASVVASKKIRSPSNKEKAIARCQGENFATYLAKFHGALDPHNEAKSNLEGKIKIHKLKEAEDIDVPISKPKSIKKILKRLSMQS
ncbi:flavoprotein WrbA [Neoconidiobolus thromboides FSU 785]|nr:flavoprotein WrbA [Neoconidiobolus thromboides FSU 785]